MSPEPVTITTANTPDAQTAHLLALQPVSGVQWIDPSTLRANSWNPNRQAPPERRLLKISLLEDGWTQPIVAGADDEIVDGYHRWKLAMEDQEIAQMTGGLIPVVRLRDLDPGHRRMSTVRHNRARGTHHVVKMADIVNDLAEEGLAPREIGRRLQMDKEEVDRLLQRGNMLQRGAGDGFNAGWVPTRDTPPDDA